ncbi:MAG: SMI1/KNR4 family protein [Lachnospiraceae bacterium]|nr:SMI1/KNR4 family protein [Lachnospiraceae bacterium]
MEGKIEKIIEEKGLYGEEVNAGGTEEEIEIFIKRSADELNVNLPDEYVSVLKEMNGIEFNGFIVYGIDESIIKGDWKQHINGLIECNKIWYENEWQKQYIFLGESNISWYVYDLEAAKYYELDNPSGRVDEEYSSFSALLEKILSDSLI